MPGNMDLSRLELLAGKRKIEQLSQVTVDLFGLGGVGGAALEALCRSGIGTIRVYDFDRVSASNINRQILATREAMGKLKVEAAMERCHSINPDVTIVPHEVQLTQENISTVIPGDCCYAVDAIDQVAAKTALLAHLYHAGAVFITSMGAGNRLAPDGVEIRDLSETSGCPLAKIMRRELRTMGIEKGITTVVSRNQPMETGNTNRTIGSSPWLPNIFGYTAAGWLVNRILDHLD